MFLEMAKDMPRGRAESLGRLLVPILVAMGVVLVVVLLWMAQDARAMAALEQEIDDQVDAAGVMLMDDVEVPRTGERSVRLLVDGRVVEGMIRVEDDHATLLVRGDGGAFVRVDPGA